MKRPLLIIVLVLLCLPLSAAVAQAEWTYHIPLSVVTSEYAILVNRDNKLDKDFEPANLVRVDLRKHTSSVIELDATVVSALSAMYSAASEVTDFTYKVKGSNGEWKDAVFSNSSGLKLMLESGFRSYSSQYSSYNNRLDRIGYDDGYVAPPGASEHQSGLACDVLNVGYYNTQSRMNSSFYQTPEAQWMEQNAPAFGFIIRYPEDKEEITQVPYEPWHLRYVGQEIALYIQQTGMSLEEFTQEWQAALDTFTANGGDVQTQLLLESTIAPPTVTTTILDIYGIDGDAEVSLTIF